MPKFHDQRRGAGQEEKGPNMQFMRFLLTLRLYSDHTAPSTSKVRLDLSSLVTALLACQIPRPNKGRWARRKGFKYAVPAISADFEALFDRTPPPTSKVRLDLSYLVRAVLACQNSRPLQGRWVRRKGTKRQNM